MPRDPDEPSIDQTIAALVGDLSPVTPVRLWRGMMVGLVATGLSVTAVWLCLGLRSDILSGHPPMIVPMRGAVLLAGGLAMLLAALRASVPGRPDGGVSLLGTLLLGLFPLGLMALLLDGIMVGDRPDFAEVDAFGVARCFAIALCASLVVAGVLAIWMRRAAPTDLARAAWLTGWAAAALGTFAYSLFCPASSMGFVTTVYPAAMLAVALLLRAVLPRILRW